MDTSAAPTLNDVFGGLMSEEVENAGAQLAEAAIDKNSGRLEAVSGYVDKGATIVETSKNVAGVLQSFSGIKTLETALSLLDGVVQVVDVVSEECFYLRYYLSHGIDGFHLDSSHSESFMAITLIYIQGISNSIIF